MTSTSTGSTLVQHLRSIRSADRRSTLAWVRFGVWLCEPEQAERTSEAILDTLSESEIQDLLPQGKGYTLSKMSQARQIAKQYVVEGGQPVESLRDFSLHAAYEWRPSESEMPAETVVSEKRQGTPPAAAAKKAGKKAGKARGSTAKRGKRAQQAEPASGAISDEVRNDRAKITMSRATFRKLNALRSGEDWDTFLNRLADQGRSAGKAPKAKRVSRKNTNTAA